MFKRIFLTVLFIFFCIPVIGADFSVHRLPNGQTLIIEEVKNNPIVTIDTWVKTGSVNENDENSGVSHFLEHLFFKGTKLHPAGEFDKILEAKGAVINAATSKDFTHYYITIPSEYFNTALELHADMLINPQIPRKELEKERKVVLEEIAKDGNTPSKKAYDNLNNMMYKSHPYKRKVIGSADVVSTMRREEILDYFNKYYAPSNMITLVVGDIDTAKTIQKVTECFNANPKKIINKHFKKEHPLCSQLRNIEYTESNTGYMIIGFRGVPIANDDTYPLDVLAQILGGGKSSKLCRNIKEQKGLALSISAANGSFRDDGIFYINANFNPQNTEKIEKNIFNEIEYIKKYGVTEEELNTAIKMLEQDTYYSRESTANIASELGYIYTLTGSSDIYKSYITNIKKVTAKDVQKAAQQYLGGNKCAISIVLPNETNKMIEKKPSHHTAQKISEYKGTIKYITDNKVTILLNQHQNNDIVAMSIIAKGGEFIEERIGEGTLAAALMLKGTKKYSSQELAQIMEENGIKIQPSCSEDMFVINVQTTTARLDLTFDILNEILNNALFDDYELEKKRSEILGKIKQKRDIPMNIAMENFKTNIYPNSVYSHSNKILEKYLPYVTSTDIKKYYNRILDSKNIIVSVNGNIDSEKLIQEFGNILKDKNAAPFKYSNYKITKLNSQKTVSEKIKDLQTAWLFIGWQTAGVDSKKDFVTLKVINTILGGGMSSRIFKSLREQDGLAYQLGSNYSAKKLGGNFTAFVGTKPETLDYSREKIMNEIKKIKMEFVSDSELADAKDRLKGGFIVALETNSEKASVTGMFEALGFGYNFLDEYIKMIDEVTASDIISTSNKYFNNIYLESNVK